MSMALAPVQGRLDLPGPCTAIGLDLPDDLGYDEWAALGRLVLATARASQWWVGDWIIHGQAAYGQRFAEALDVTGLASDTLRHAVEVCVAVPLADRRPNLSFSHHREVLAADEGERAGWLDAATVGDWSCAELRQQIRDSKAVEAEAREPELLPRPLLSVRRECRATVALALPALEAAAAALSVPPEVREAVGEVLAALREAAS